MKELLELLPEKYKNEDFYENLFNYYKEKESASYIFKYIPDEYKTKRMAIEALNENKFIWWYIPKKLIDIDDDKTDSTYSYEYNLRVKLIPNWLIITFVVMLVIAAIAAGIIALKKHKRIIK